jgi:hypothetical protein
VPTESVVNICDGDLLSHHRPDTRQVNPKLTDLPQESESRLASCLRHVPSVAVCTLAALTAQDFTRQALAIPAADVASQPQIKEAGKSLSATEKARLEPASSTMSSPESLAVQEFSSDAVPIPKSSIAPTSVGVRDVAMPTSGNLAPQATGVTVAKELNTGKGGEDVGTQGRGDTGNSSMSSTPSPISNPQLAEQSHGARDLLAVVTPEPSPSLVESRNNSTVREAMSKQPLRNAPGQDSTVVAQNSNQPSDKKLCPQPQAIALRQDNTVVAQNPSSGKTLCPEVDELRTRLRNLENLKVDDSIQASPALSIVIPTAFGADNNTGFISATYQQRTRYSDVSDGALGIGIGLGDAQKSVGVELSYAIASFGGSRDFGAGGFNVKLHRQLGDGWAVATGWNGFLNLGGRNDFENSVYGAVSKIIRTRDDINLPFSRVAITAGVGSGQFRTEDAVAKDSGGVNVFGNVAVRVAKPVSLIAEWSGQDLGVGLSIAPFKNIPLVITPAVRDIVGAGDGPRFVLGTGMAFKF